MKSLMLVAIAALSCAAFAQGPEGPKGGLQKRIGRGPGMAERGRVPRGGMNGGVAGDSAVMAAMNPKVAEKIGLSDDVQMKLKQLDLDFRHGIKDLQKKMRAAMDKQAKLMKEPKIDEGAVMSAIDELFDVRKEMAKAQTRRVIAVKSLLTPEQLEKAVQEIKRVREERRAKRAKEHNTGEDAQ